MNLRLVGKSVLKPDALNKVTGKALYAGDLKRENMLYAKAVRCPYGHALILSVDPAPGLAVPGVKAVLTSRDIPGDNHVGMTGSKDQRVLAEEKVRFHGEAVAVVAAETPAAAAEGAGKVAVTYQALPVIETPEQGLQENSTTVSENGNLCWHKKVVRGDWVKAAKSAAAVVTGEYRTQTVEHAYLEPEAVLVEPDGEGILVWSTTKSVHLDRREIARVLKLPIENVHVAAPHIGGSFGGKSDLTLNCMAALLCWKTGKPVSMVQDREESMQVTTKRHACILKYTHAADAGGKLTAVRLELIADAGAYTDYTPAVMQRMIVHGAGPYRVPNAWLEGWGVLTNNPVAGAMRGFGVPQVDFACERQMDRLAEKLGIDPVELRLKNILEKGDVFVTGQEVEHSTGLKEGLVKAREVTGRTSFSAGPGETAAWGMACFHYGNGRTGMSDPGVATIRLLEDGKVQVAVGSPDIGQGSNTVLAQIASEALGLELHHVSLISADTRHTLDSGTTSGTRLTSVVGRAVRDAAESWRAKFLEVTAGLINVPVDDIRLDAALQEARVICHSGTLSFREIYQRALAAGVSLEATTRYDPPTTDLDRETGQGNPYFAYTYGILLAGLSVNKYTGKIDLKRLVSILNVGQVVNPVLLEGQVEGGAVMGIGYALLEEIKLKGGRVLNPNFSSYLIPTSCDVVPVDCCVLPLNDQEGPYGAIGIGEPSTIPVAAAIANAVSHATGVQYFNLPLSLEEVVEGIQQKVR